MTNPYDSPSQQDPSHHSVWERSPAFILILSLVTCGLYLIYWYYQVYEEMERLHSVSPTGNAYFLDLLLVIVTCGLWGIYVDYAISDKLNEIQKRYNMPPNDTTTTSVLLDLAAYLVGFTNFVTSMIQQDQLNKIREAMSQSSGSSFASASPSAPDYTESQSPRANPGFGKSDDTRPGDFGSFGNKDDGNPYS